MAGKNVAVRDAVLRQRIQKGARDVVLSRDVGEALRAIFACQYLIAHRVSLSQGDCNGSADGGRQAEVENSAPLPHLQTKDVWRYGAPALCFALGQSIRSIADREIRFRTVQSRGLLDQDTF